MMLIHLDTIQRDLKKCIRKRWYIGLDKEIKKVIKLLATDLFLPGQSVMREFKGELSGRVLHSRIALKDFRVGKLEGPRIVYYIPLENKKEIIVLYLGGHKDKNYGSPKFINLVTNRFLDDRSFFVDYEEFNEIKL